MSAQEPEKPFRLKILEGIEDMAPFFFKIMGIAALVSGFVTAVGNPFAVAVGLISPEHSLVILEKSNKSMELGIELLAVGYLVEIAHNTRRPR